MRYAVKSYLSASFVAMVLALYSTDAHATAQTAALFGEVIDLIGGRKPISDAIITVTSPAMQGEQTAISDEKGRYRIDQLLPGDYSIKVLAPGFKDYEVNNVRLLASREIKVKIEMVTEVVTGATINVTQTIVSSIDQGSTSTGVTLTKDYMERVATARNFEQVTGATPGAQKDTYGISFGGTTSPENAFFVDGMNVQGVEQGNLSLDLPLEFFDQVEVKVGGYMPEFGNATGGFVNTVTKKGSNDVHGSVFSYTTPLRLPALQIERFNESVTGQLGLDVKQEIGFEVGGPIVKDLVWFHVGFSPALQSDYMTRRLRKQMADPANPGSVKLDSSRNPVMQDMPEFDRKFGRFTQAYRLTANITFALAEDHRLGLTAQANPSHSGGMASGLAPGNPASSLVNADESTFMGSTRSGTYKLTLNYDGKFAKKKVLVDALVGYMQEDSLDNAATDYGQNNESVTWVNTQNITRFEPNLASQCNESLLQANGKPGIRCPVRRYRTGGYGFIEYKRGERITARANVAGLFTAAGSHQLKGGIEFQRASQYNRRGYTGGGSGQVLPPGGLGYALPDPLVYYDARNFKEPDPNDPNGLATKSLDPWTSSIYYHNYTAYLQDSWTIFDKVNLNGGVRLDLQDMYGGAADTYRGGSGHTSTLRITNWSPRVGLIYDPLQNGRSKLFASFARQYELIPLGMWNRSVPAERSVNTVRKLCDDRTPNQNCAAILRDFVSGLDPTLVLQGTRGQFVDRYEAGAEFQITQDLMIGGNYTHSELGDAVEDFSTDDGKTYFIGNPGPLPAGQKAVDPLTGKETTLTYQSLNAVTNRKEDAAFPKPQRKYDAMNVYITKSLAKNWILQASYTLSFLRGHFSGLFRPETGQLDSNLTSELDLVSLLGNRYGYLPADRTHQFKVDGAYIIEVSERFALVPNLIIRAGTGQPTSYLGPHPRYGAGEAFLLTRGAGDRSDPLFQADLGFKGEYVFSKDSRLTVGITFVNLGSVQLATARDQDFTQASSYVRPIFGGDRDDLTYAKDINGRPVLLNPNYGRVTGRQTPMELRIDAKLTF